MFESHLPSTVPIELFPRQNPSQKQCKWLNFLGLKKRGIYFGHNSIGSRLYINVKFQGCFYIIVKNQY
jgi:hypothetical protein